MNVTFLQCKLPEELRKTYIEADMKLRCLELFEYEAGLQNKTLSDFDIDSVMDLVSKIVTDVNYCVVAMTDKVVVGMLFSVTDKPHEIQLLYLNPTYRRCGIGQRLIQCFQNHIGKHTVMRVECLEINTNALQFYRKVGFVFEDREEGSLNVKGRRMVQL